MSAVLMDQWESSGTGSRTRRTTESAQVLEKVLSNPVLPSPPVLALQIVQKASQPDCDIREIGVLLSQDPALCAKFLKTVNSTLFGLSRPVTSIERAIPFLGLKPLRSLVLGLSLPAMQFRQVADEVVQTYWKWSVAGAIIARELALRIRRPAPEDDLVAGLLRDLGILLLQQAFPKEFQDLWTTERAAWTARPLEVETKRWGLHHAEVSAALLHSWGLPAELVEPIHYHHQPQQLTNQTHGSRAILLALASQLAQLDELVGQPAVIQDIFQQAHEHFQLDQAGLESFLTAVKPKIELFAAVIQVDIGGSPLFASVLNQGCEELVKITMETSLTREAKDFDLGNLACEAAPSSQSPKSERTIDFATPARRRASGMGPIAATHDGDNKTLPEFSLDMVERPSGKRVLGYVDHYEIHAEIGRGAMGVVLKAYDPGLARYVAIKLLTPERANCYEARKRFAREARSAAAIRHDNVVAIYAVSQHQGLPYLVMEYVPGVSLQDRLDQKYPFTVEEILLIGMQMADGLAAAHQQRLIHRDVKPANILLEQNSHRVKITDFGLARAVDDTKLSQDGLLIGTPLFMSPEQVLGEALDHRTDLFSLGGVLYTLCTGQPPFPGDAIMTVLHHVCETEPVPVHKVNPKVPAWLSAAIKKLLAKKPNARFAAAADVAELFQGYLQ